MGTALCQGTQRALPEAGPDREAHEVRSRKHLGETGVLEMSETPPLAKKTPLWVSGWGILWYFAIINLL